ncbi:MAG: hypothetical protein GY739_12220 [Mesoflavibacter sp.]|nr:hypothetical protein [Mesoflavibacter sp.]
MKHLINKVINDKKPGFYLIVKMYLLQGRSINAAYCGALWECKNKTITL